MDIIKAKEFISALAEGIDPTTGEVLSEESVYNDVDVVRALYTVLNALDTKTTKKFPENAGKPWTADEENRLIELYNNGLSKKDISKELCRTTGSVSSRLKKLGFSND